MGIWQWLGLSLYIVSLTGEAVADLQLLRFKQARQGSICQIGLWRYSRHPNYYFEWLVWMSFAMLGISSTWGLLGFIGPMILFVVMFFITGPITERQSLAKHGSAFEHYQKQTSYFFLWFAAHKG